MTNSTRRLRLMLLWLAGILAAVMAVNWIVNPYGAWRTTEVGRVYVVPAVAAGEAGERITIAYRVRAARPTTLLVGSSRVLLGMPVASGGSDDVFNASISGASLAEIAGILRLAIANPRLKRVIWGLDFFAFEDRFTGFRHPETRVLLEGGEPQATALRVRETLLSLQALDDSRRSVSKAANIGDKLVAPLPVPWPEPVIRERLENPGPMRLDRIEESALRSHFYDWVLNYADCRLSDVQFSLFETTVAKVRAAGVELIVFVPPLSRWELEVIDQAGKWNTFQHWKRRLLDAGPYWDFSGYGKLDRMDGLFLDVAHFTPAVGHVILRTLLSQGCAECGEAARPVVDAGVWVDAAGVDDYLSRQDAARATRTRRNDLCEKLVAEMLRAVGAPSTATLVSSDGIASDVR